ncbi:YhhA family cyclophane-containing RiPP [Hymenobacter ginsengisoli]
MQNPPLSNNPLHHPDRFADGALLIDAQQAPSALLARLIQEVQNESHSTLTAYNRTHNRHNRGR